jgi:hypothetical protein
MRLLFPTQGYSKGVILVGGPGNGKTEAIEFAIDALDEALGACGAVRGSAASRFAADDGEPPPRIARVDVSALTGGRHAWSLGIVQDASAPDPAAPLVGLAELLVQELQEVLDWAATWSISLALTAVCWTTHWFSQAIRVVPTLPCSYRGWLLR